MCMCIARHSRARLTEGWPRRVCPRGAKQFITAVTFDPEARAVHYATLSSSRERNVPFPGQFIERQRLSFCKNLSIELRRIIFYQLKIENIKILSLARDTKTYPFQKLVVLLDQASKSPKETLSNFPIPRITDLPIGKKNLWFVEWRRWNNERRSRKLIIRGGKGNYSLDKSR